MCPEREALRRGTPSAGPPCRAGSASRARVRVNAVYGPGQHAAASLLVSHGRGHGQRWSVGRARRVSSSRRVRRLTVGAWGLGHRRPFHGAGVPRSLFATPWLVIAPSSRPHRVRGVAAALSVSACTAPAVPVRAAGKRRLSRPLLAIARCPPALSWSSGVPPAGTRVGVRRRRDGTAWRAPVSVDGDHEPAPAVCWASVGGRDRRVNGGPDPPDGRTREDRAFGGIRPAGPVGPTTSRRAPPGDASAGAVFCGRRVNDVYCPAASSPRTTAGFVRPPVGCRRRRDCRRGSVRPLRTTSFGNAGFDAELRP